MSFSEDLAEQIRRTVVDAQTGRGPPGVVVVASWHFNNVGIGHGSTGGSIKTIEVVTDRGGGYAIPGLGPRLCLPLSYLGEYSPRLRYFKPKYYPAGHSNH